MQKAWRRTLGSRRTLGGLSLDQSGGARTVIEPIGLDTGQRAERTA